MQTAAEILTCFREQIETVARKHRLHDLLGLAGPEQAVEKLLFDTAGNYIEVNRFIETATPTEVCRQIEERNREKPATRILIAPHSPLFASVHAAIVARFPNVVLVDKSRAGLQAEGLTVVSPDDLKPEEGDLCVILTRNLNAIDYYEGLFGQANCLNVTAWFLESALTTLKPSTKQFVDKVNEAEKPVIFCSVRPMATVSATLRQMQADGVDTFWLGAEDVSAEHQVGYATPRSKDVPVGSYAIGDLMDLLVLLSRQERGIALLHYESLYPTNWDFKRAALCYAVCIALLRTVKTVRVPHSTAKAALYMYDAIKPGVRHQEAGDACDALYKEMLCEAESVIFSSYTDEFGDFVENSIGKTLPRVHCHRYQVAPKARRPRRTDGYHVAIISVMLEEFDEPSRVGLVSYIRDILAQHIHIHYYAGVSSHPKAMAFKASLPGSDQPYFHLHKPIHDLDLLAEELSQYHVGWSLFNMRVFNEIVSCQDNQFIRDAMDVFTPTTLPSVIWTTAAAGLPVICNRDMYGVRALLPDGMSIPATLSELQSLRQILDAVDWDKVNATDLSVLDIAHHIDTLYDHFTEITDVDYRRAVPASAD